MINAKEAETIEEAIELLGKFKYEADEDSDSNSFFEARINEDWFFHVKHKLEKLLVEVKVTAPARTCSDERPCINCYADQGNCLGPYKEERVPEIFPGTLEALGKLGA